MFKRFAVFICVIAVILPFSAFSEEIREDEMPVAVDSPYVSLDDQPDTLRQAQRHLIALGYLAGGADGIFGSKTEAALRAFQQDNGLSATGHLDAETLSLLSQLASSSASIADVQQRLIDLGYLQGRADGIWGPKSAAAIEVFQQLNGLPETGVSRSELIDALFSEGAVALPKGLPVGSKGEEVAALQQKLIQFGFLAGKADGAYGKQTAKAVSAFQRHLAGQGVSVKADGTASSLTLYYLYGEDYSSYLSDVSLGTTGSEAQRVETRLASLGYMDASADDSFDEYAVEALTLFQNKAQLPANGVADRETITSLFSASAPAADRCALHGISTGDKGLVVRYVEEALLTGGMSIIPPGGRYNSAVETAVERLCEYLQSSPDTAALFADKTQLSKEAVTALLDGLLGAGSGDTADKAEARRIQRRLHSLYYLSKDGVDGQFGENSRNALRAFQAANGLGETGEADPSTLERLFSSAAVAKPYPYRVEVSLAAQTVTVYQLNGQGGYDEVKRFPCSSGLHGSTPRGIFLDGFPVNRWHYFTKFDCWAQYSFVIEGNIMFHSVLYSAQDESTLRVNSVYALGSPASHGCIRLQVKDAKWLFEHCKRGSVVILIY